MIKHVIWDWNGTLLDDVDCCVETLNTLLRERDLAPVDRSAYRGGFGFPVRRYYEALGFDFRHENFPDLSRQFISRYRARLASVRLHGEAQEVLRIMGGRVQRQLVVSAMHRTLLAEMLDAYGVAVHLETAHGVDDMDATSKVSVGCEVVKTLGYPPKEFLLVGDTLHDHELATAIGCPCVLFARGHQSRERLQESGRPIVDDLHEIPALLPQMVTPC